MHRLRNARRAVTRPRREGIAFEPGGPQASGSDYFRVIATLIVIAPSRTLTVNAVVIVIAATQRCSMSGTAVTAT